MGVCKGAGTECASLVADEALRQRAQVVVDVAQPGPGQEGGPAEVGQDLRIRQAEAPPDALPDQLLPCTYDARLFVIKQPRAVSA